MRRRLAVAAVICGIVTALALVAALTLDPLGEYALWALALGASILAFVGMVLTTVFAIVLPLFGAPESFVSAAALQQASAAGRDGLARVLSAHPTGAKINNAWVYDVDLVVDGTAAPTYRSRDRVRVKRAAGYVRGGEIIAVVRPRAESAAVVVTAGPDQVPQDSLVPSDAPGWMP